MFTNLVNRIAQFVSNFGQGFAPAAYQANVANAKALLGNDVDIDSIPASVWRRIPTV